MGGMIGFLIGFIFGGISIGLVAYSFGWDEACCIVLKTMEYMDDHYSMEVQTFRAIVKNLKGDNNE